MLKLKRLYKRDEKAMAALVGTPEEGDVVLVEPHKVIGIEIQQAGRKAKFSRDLLVAGAAEGWLTLGQGKVTLHGVDGDVVYTVTRAPGYYCSHCGVKLPGDPAIPDGVKGAAERLAHVTSKHPGAKSPDPENPSGYMGTHGLKCLKEGA